MSKTSYAHATPPQRSLLETGKNAAYFALRGWDVALTPMDREDLGQVAAAEYWEALNRTRGDGGVAWYSAQRRVRRYYNRVLLGNNPYADSLDVPAYEGDNRSPPSRLQFLASYDPGDQEGEGWPSARWLSDDDLVELVHEMQQYKRPTKPALRRLAQILRLLCEGYDNAAIGVVLGTSEASIKGTRRQLKRWLRDYAERVGVDTSSITWGPGGWRRAHDYGLSGKRLGRRGEGSVAARTAWSQSNLNRGQE